MFFYDLRVPSKLGKEGRKKWIGQTTFYTLGLAMAAAIAGSGALAVGQEPSAHEAQQRREERFVPGRLLVKFKDGVSTERARGVLAGMQARSERVIEGMGVHVVSLPPGLAESAALQRAQHAAEVEYAELDGIGAPQGLTPNDPLYSGQWALPRIKADEAWTQTTGSASVIIAVLDTGVDGTHPDLAALMFPGRNIFNGNTNTADINGHGTLMAGLSAALTNNGNGVAGTCWTCRIMPVRVSMDNSSTTYSLLADGIRWAADNGAKVAVAAYVFNTSQTVTDAAQYFRSRGGVVVMPVGNTAYYMDPSPDNPQIITVSGTDSADQVPYWSSTGNNVDVSAPADYLRTTAAGGIYGYASGTSYATALVGGAAALVMAKNPALTPDQVTTLLKQNADDFGAPGWDPSYGAGRLNVQRAVAAAASGTTDSQPPSAPAGLSASAPDSTRVNLNWSASTDNVGVAGYRIYRGGTLVGTAATTTFADTSVIAGTAYSYTVSAYDAAGNISLNSNTASVTVPAAPDTQAPTAPANLTGNASSSTSVSLSWQSSTDNVAVTGYSVYRGGVQIGTSTATSYVDSTVAAGQTYSYTVKAQDAANNLSAASNAVAVTTPQPVDSQAPSAPLALNATATSSTSVSLSWQSSTDNVAVTGYLVYRGGVQIGSTSATSYVDSTVSGGQTYSYTVKARDAANNLSAASNPASVTTPAPADTQAPSAPANLTGSATANSVSLSWTAASDNVGVTGYLVYRGGVQIGSTTATSYLDSTVSSGQAYVYTVKARDSANNISVASNSFNVTTQSLTDTQPPTAPTGLTAAAITSTSVSLVWQPSTDNAGVARYEVYRGVALIGTATSTSFTDTTVSQGQTYSYTVRAKDAAGNASATSNAVSVTVPRARGKK